LALLQQFQVTAASDLVLVEKGLANLQQEMHINTSFFCTASEDLKPKATINMFDKIFVSDTRKRKQNEWVEK
jgi:hypothetical protein